MAAGSAGARPGVATAPQTHATFVAFDLREGINIDRLDDRWNDGDLLLQVCADDELAVRHAVRLLSKEARTFVTVRWVQHGFRGPTGGERRPRNLMGQVDGTANPAPGELDDLVWVSERTRSQFGEQPDWLLGGTTMVVRRIAMNLDTGDELDLEAVGPNGLEVIGPFAHVRRARTDDRSQRFLRRPYNFDDPPLACPACDRARCSAPPCSPDRSLTPPAVDTPVRGSLACAVPVKGIR
ncbi:hypothetical protein GCM10009821_10220 [Aeromicrobium halocynthiae]|uniref:Uncharacterized protein n=1 Tax=Aeromicrobium halocynthiae TaxID=560557 RepID=A0ABN2VVM0_9ACTN